MYKRVVEHAPSQSGSSRHGKMRNITDPATNTIYCLKHLKPLDVSYNIKIDGVPRDVSLKALFSKHCYTRSRKDSDHQCVVLFTEKKRHGVIDERVFCPKRWQFSKELPGIILNLHSKHCYLGDNYIFYRQECAPLSNTHAGWYICMRLGVSEQHRNLTLSVRSVHWRENRPIGSIRGGQRRFFAVLTSFYTKHRLEKNWIE
jgi:hypothetical protein